MKLCAAFRAEQCLDNGRHGALVGSGAHGELYARGDGFVHQPFYA